MKLRDYTYEASVIFSSSTVRLRSMIADASALEAEEYPEDFRGDTACIFCKCDYVFPYDKFDGLRRYILSVKDNTGLRDSFRGYIALDLTEWTDHVDEDYFNIFIMYLADHSEGIHYMLFFGARDEAQKVSIIKALRQYMSVRVIDAPMKLSGAQTLKRTRRDQH